ncbi:hypothetical protein [Streptomyces sp. 11-1-2]|uniref:hypothetical protein n=1 Tax=Streptomyces sp. 11-1-2 TaxID=1851167 RepID=UPI0013C42B70|nr:hypothetical protein [Streptomyces sp. 11-1-2]
MGAGPAPHAVRAAPLNTHVPADGFSRRTRTAQHSDRNRVHPARLIASAPPPAR